jgi:predicted transcriptional regulator
MKSLRRLIIKECIGERLFGKKKIEQIAATRLDKAKCEIAAIVQEDGRVANPIGQKILLGELETIQKNLTLALESLQNPADAKQAGITSYNVGVGLKRLCDATLNDPKWVLQAAVGTDRCRTRVAKILRTVEEIAERLMHDTRGNSNEISEGDTEDKEEKQITVGSSPSLLEYLDAAKGTDELYEMLRTRSASEIEALCKTFPIEALRLDWNSIQRDFRNNKRFELILVFTQILLKYEKILEKNPELQLPKSLPAKELSEILMSRLMPFIRRQQGVDIAQGLRPELYDFAMDLIRVGRNFDALTCLLVSRPSLKGKAHDFWICSCRFNIAQDTKKKEDISAAIHEIERFLSQRTNIPQDAIRTAEKMLITLWQRLKE